MAQRVRNLPAVAWVTAETWVRVRFLTSRSRLRIQHYCITAPIHPLAWECPYAAGMAIKKKKKRKKTLGILSDAQKDKLQITSLPILQAS